MAPRTGLYVHWPYCERICPYCDFNVARARDIDLSRWRQVLMQDIRQWREKTGARPLTSIYFGGGTPSLMPPDLVADIIDKSDALFGLEPNVEITLEANPTDAEIERFHNFRVAGVNRLSLGVQSFEDQHLKFLGRNHSGEHARLALDRAVDIFPSVTFDLIYALPMETLDEWRARLAFAAQLGARHMSLYQLTIEKQTAFDLAVSRGDWQPPDEESAATLYEVTQQVMTAAGMPAYEVSNHARPGEEAIHNALYWEGADWIGIGPGAHGRLSLEGNRIASVGHPSIGQYLDKRFADRFELDALDDIAIAIERLAGGLRPLQGLDIADLAPSVLTAISAKRAALVEMGFLEDIPDRLVVKSDKRLLVDGIVRELTNVL